MATELATAYISLVPTFKGGTAAITKELVGAAKTGADETEKAYDKTSGRIADGLKKTIAGAGTAAGVLLGKGVLDGMGAEVSADKFAAQMGLDTGSAEAKQYGTVAGKLYGRAYGDSLADSYDAIKSVSQAGLLPEAATDKQIEGITAKAMRLASVFDQDVGDASAAAGQIIKTGLAKNATEAFDIMTAGFQAGVDKRGDFLDTLNEYGTQMRKVGIDGQTMTGLLSQGLKAGARDADLVADSIKEFSIRAIDGSELTAQGFKDLGLDGEKMAKQIAAGGPEAAKALDVTLDRLRAMKDPVEQSKAAVALFGTQAEDLGAALYSLDPSSAVAGLGKVKGAADGLNVAGDNAPRSGSRTSVGSRRPSKGSALRSARSVRLFPPSQGSPRRSTSPRRASAR